MEDMKDIFKLLAALGLGSLTIILMIFIAVTPVTMLHGFAKAKYLKETKGIELTWYEAAFLNIDIKMSESDMNVNANLSLNKDKECSR
jgi:hypothetical protein